MADVFNPRGSSNNVPTSNTRPTPINRGTTSRPRPATYAPRRIQRRALQRLARTLRYQSPSLGQGRCGAIPKQPA